MIASWRSGGRGGGEAVPVGDPVHDCGDAGGVGAVGEAGELQLGVALAGGLVADEAGEEAAVDLGQDHVHGKVGGREATVGRRPVAAAGGGEGDLEDRALGCVEGGRSGRRTWPRRRWR